MGLIALDTSALVAYLDRGDALHDAARTTVASLAHDRHFFAVSAITWSELMVGVARQHLEDTAVRLFFAELAIEVLPIGTAVADRAAVLRATASLELTEALILATADLRSDIVAIVTGDRRWARVEGLSTEVLVLEEDRR